MGKVKLEKEENLNEKLNSLDNISTKDILINKKRKILKNLIFYCLSYLFQFAAYNGLANLQTSLNSNDNLGIKSMITISLTFALTCLYLPSIFNKILNGFKWPIFISHIFLCLFVVANFYPTNYTLIPVSIFGGAAMGLLWTYQGSFIAELANQYVLVSKYKIDDVLIKFFGIFGLIFQFSKKNLKLTVFAKYF
jgi:hypothetical protein